MPPKGWRKNASGPSTSTPTPAGPTKTKKTWSRKAQQPSQAAMTKLAKAAFDAAEFQVLQTTLTNLVTNRTTLTATQNPNNELLEAIDEAIIGTLDHIDRYRTEMIPHGHEPDRPEQETRQMERASTQPTQQGQVQSYGQGPQTGTAAPAPFPPVGAPSGQM